MFPVPAPFQARENLKDLCQAGFNDIITFGIASYGLTYCHWAAEIVSLFPEKRQGIGGVGGLPGRGPLTPWHPLSRIKTRDRGGNRPEGREEKETTARTADGRDETEAYSKLAIGGDVLKR